jgi:hypothetical protein
VSPSEVVVITAQNEPFGGCRELGILAITDGALHLSDSCSCERPEVVVGTESGATSTAVAAAARLGANVLWVLKVVRSDTVRTHAELCCSVSGFRLYAVAFACDPGTIRTPHANQAH